MANVEHLPIDRGVPIGEIEDEMSRLLAEGGSSDPRLMRLGFIHLRYKGFSVKEASGIVGVTPQMGYRWQKSWNEEGMSPFVSPVRSGRRSRLTPEQKEDVLDRVSGALMTTAEARDMLAREYGTDYSVKQVHVILSTGGLMHKRVGGGPMVWTRDDDYPKGL